MDDPRLRDQTQVGQSEEVPIAVTLRRASHSDQPAIASFIEEAYGARAQYKAAPRWTWQFIDNPYGRRTDDEIPVWVAVDGDRVVGQVAVQNTLLQVEGKTFEAGWAVEIMILPSHRGAGLGQRLHDATATDVDILMALTMDRASRRMAERHGCVTLAEVHQLTRWVRLEPETVRRYLLARTQNHRRAQLAARFMCRVFRFHQLFPRVANPLLRLRDVVKQPLRGPRAATIVEVDRFGPEVDELWERTRGDYPVISPRDAQFLNWRFVDCPAPSYRCFVARRGGRAVGYVVLRRAEPVEWPQGIIVDLYAARQDVQTLDELVRHSLAFFGDTVSAVECGTSVSELQAVLRKHSFFRTRAHHPTCICSDGALGDRLAQLRNDWFLSKADQDWDQIQVAGP